MQSPAGASVSAASGVDCWVEFTYRSTDRAPAVCMHSAPGHADPGAAAIYVGVSPVTGKIRHYIYLAGAWSDTTVTATEGMRIRARRNTSNAWQVEYSTNGGASWSVAAADVASGASTQYPKGAVYGILTDTTFRARYSGFKASVSVEALAPMTGRAVSATTGLEKIRITRTPNSGRGRLCR